jgi:hypothetical protein
VVEKVIAKTLHEKPREATHWSSRTMAKASGLSQTAVVRIWRAFGLQPHRAETFKLSTDPLFIEKVRDIVGLYLNPPERALVLCKSAAVLTAAPSSWSAPFVITCPSTTAIRNHSCGPKRLTKSLKALSDSACELLTQDTSAGSRIDAKQPSSSERII